MAEGLVNQDLGIRARGHGGSGVGFGIQGLG